MKEIKIKTALIESVAERAGQTAEEYVSHSRSISCGRKVCAHFKGRRGDYSIFSCD